MASSGRRDLCGSETQSRASESMAGSDALINMNFTGDYHAKHVPCGSVCRFCQRSDEAANPIQHANPARKGQPTLPWRRQHGQECAICPWAINDSETYSALSRQKIADDNKNPEKRAIFMTECVDPYENKKVQSGGKRAVGAINRKVGTKVIAKTFSSMEYNKNCGILWPLKLYEARWGKAKKKDVGLHDINGAKVRGVTMDEEHGCPTGCLRMSQKSGTMASKESEMANSTDDIEDEAKDVFDKMQKRTRLDTTARDDGVVKIVVPRIKLSNDCSSDEEILSALWGNRMAGSAGRKGKDDSDADEDAEEKGGQGKKGGKKRASQKRKEGEDDPSTPKPPRPTKTAKSKDAPSASNTDPSSPANLKKANHEMDIAEQTILVAEQMLKKMQEATSFLAVTMKQVDNTYEKIKGRLSVDMIKLYSIENSVRGSGILEKLRELQKYFDVLKDLAAALTATEGDLATSSALDLALGRARVAGLQVSKKADEMVTLRSFKAALGAGDFSLCKNLLDETATSTPFGLHRVEPTEKHRCTSYG